MVAQENECPKVDEREQWIYTYGDLVTLLCCFFILLFAMSSVEAEKLKAISQAIRGGPPASPYIFQGMPSFMENVVQQISQSTVGEDITINVDDNGIMVSFNDSVLFEAGSATPTEEAIEKMERFARLLHALTNGVIIEGHTDNIPMKSSVFPSNWELSAARAGSIARLMEGFGVESNRLEIAAFGSTRPKFPNDSPETRALNRRIDILIKPDEL